MKLATSMPYDANIGFGEPDTYGEWVPVYPVYLSSRPSNNPVGSDSRGGKSKDVDLTTTTVEAESDAKTTFQPTPDLGLARLPPPTYLTRLRNQRLIAPLEPDAPVTSPVQESEIPSPPQLSQIHPIDESEDVSIKSSSLPVPAVRKKSLNYKRSPICD